MIKQKKISLIIHDYQVGGLEKAFISLANSFCLFFKSVELISLDDFGPLEPSVSHNVHKVILKSKKYRTFISKLTTHINKSRPDIIYTGLFSSGLSAVISKFFAKHKPIIIVGVKNNYSIKYLIPDNIKDKYVLKYIAPTLFKFANYFICSSKGIAEEFNKHVIVQNDRIKVIHEPVEFKSLIDDKEKINNIHIKNFYNINYKYNILSVGRLVEQKGYDFLIKVAKELKEKKLSFSLTIIGDGPLRSELNNLIDKYFLQKNVKLVGFKADPFPYIKSADLFIVSSKWEGLNIALIEAMSMGIKVISTDCPYGPSEVLMNGQYGKLVPNQNIEKMTEAILNVLQGKYDIQKKDLIKRSKDFSVKTITHQHIDFFKTINNI